jgi:cation transport ATPase
MPPRQQKASPQIQTWISLFSAAGILIHLVLRYFFHAPALVAGIPLYLAVAAGGAPLLWSLGQRLIRLEFGSDLLAGLSIVASILTGQYLVGSIIVLMLAGGGTLETYASRHANSVLAALQQRAPKIAHRKASSAYTDVALEDVKAGDVLVILAHEIVPVDGTVVEGHGRMDESYLTGEPFEISKVHPFCQERSIKIRS